MITDAYVTFFKGLEKNNNKEWFHDHKVEYERDAKQAFLDLLESLIPMVRQLEPKISINAKDALFRINKDIRFSKDKTPYHTLIKAGFSAEGRKSKLPGYYLGISADSIHMGGGLFNLDSQGVKDVRNLIAEETDMFVDIVEHRSFKELFGALKGDKAKRLDKALVPILSKTPYVANKQFYAMAELPLKNHLNSDKLPSIIFNYFKAIHPLNQFLYSLFK